MKALFLCAYTPAIAYYAKKVLAINQRYCDKHGYGLLCETDEHKIIEGCAGRSTFWYYFRQLEANFGRPDVEWFVKLDCDAVCVNHDSSLDCWLDQDYDLIYSTDIGPDIINAGVQLIRNNEVNRQFYERVWTAAERVARGQYKTGIWHEQTMLSAAVALNMAERPRTLLVPHSGPNSFDCFYDGKLEHAIIFHDISKKLIPRLAPRPEKPDRYIIMPEAKKEAVDLKDAPIAVVYYAYLVNDWRPMVAEQIARVRRAGLFDAAKEVWVITCGKEADSQEVEGICGGDPKIKYQHHVENTYEYWPTAKIKELAETGDWKILYFHTKGVANLYADLKTTKLSERKVAGKRGWRKFLEYFCLDHWKECATLLDTHDIVVAFYDHVSRWPWGNFWWATSEHLRTRDVPVAGADRWYFEAWVAERGKPPRIYEFKHLEFDFHTSDWPDWLYDGSRDTAKERIQIVDATYGSVDVQIDEGRPVPRENPRTQNVKDQVAAAVEGNGQRLSIQADNGVMGGDPDFGAPKMLKVWWTLADRPDEPVYYAAAMEGMRIVLEL